MKTLITGIIIAVLPLYSFISWIIIFNNEKLKSQEARVIAYRKVFFNLIENIMVITLLNIAFSLLSIYFLGNNFTKKSKTLKVLSSFFIIIMILLLLFNLQSLM